MVKLQKAALSDKAIVQFPYRMAKPYVPAVFRGRLVDHETFLYLTRAREHMAAHFDEAMTLAEAADAACMSPFHFHRRYCQAFGETPLEFITRLRLEAAQRLLTRSSLTILEVCAEVGYGSPSSFSAWFERHVGTRPSEFRRIYSLPEKWFLRHVPGCYAFFNGIPSAK